MGPWCGPGTPWPGPSAATILTSRRTPATTPCWRTGPGAAPRLRHRAQPGHIVRLKTRPGTVHDSRGAVRFLRELIHELRDRFGRGLPLEFRMDAAFFQEEILTLLARGGCEDAIKVGVWKGGGREGR